LPDSKTLPAREALDSSEGLSPPTFEKLAVERKLLQDFCSLHIQSVETFLARSVPVFKLNHEEKEPSEFKHITSSATCFESIDKCPEQFRPDKNKDSKNLKELGTEFARTAIDSSLDKWKSDKAAEIYCSCRGLPYVLSQLETWHPKIDEHLDRIFYQLRDPGRFAIGEAKEDKTQLDKVKERESWYKPNAYHTYWTLELLRILGDSRFEAGRIKSKHFAKAQTSRDQMRAWARQQLGFQVALHSADSSVLDSDQLAWSLAIMISQPQLYESHLAEQDFIRQAFKCLFSTQERVGTWRHYAPLFHYPSVGNAYCYVFETFAAILTEALKPEAGFVRTTLKQYFVPLMQLWRYSVSTQTKSHNGELAWSSGHRINPCLESWATGSVFEFAQALRRLVGIWTRDAALPSLNYKMPFPAKEKAREKAIERAQVWTSQDLADRLWTMFVNPVSTAQAENEVDPDQPLVGKNNARAAILFGPPGTSKTALVSAIAGAIGWKYIELHPSHFVADGLPNVQHTADLIFSKLMELDHAVVLFDEIDELVRERDIEPDQFGRFLTTSMLPRLAELWKARKIMYFVATNHIEYFDRAITRSERFDAIILVSPPSFHAKTAETLRILKDDHGIKVHFDKKITQESIEAAMPADLCKSAEGVRTKQEREQVKGQALPGDRALAKFALLRWDELNELALHLKNGLAEKKVITEDALKAALLNINDTKSRSLGAYCRFISDKGDYERFDASRKAVWVITEIEGRKAGAPLPAPVETVNGLLVVRATVGPMTNVEIPGFRVEAADEKGEAGRIKLRKS